MKTDIRAIAPSSGPWVGVCPFPLPPQQAVRAIRLLAGLRRLEALQIEMAAKLIDLLDENEADPDDEPELAAAEQAGGHAITFDQRRWSAGVDAEVSLGASADVNQRWWGIFDYHFPDREEEHNGREPDSDTELCCEDEGAQCDDEGAYQGDEG